MITNTLDHKSYRGFWSLICDSETEPSTCTTRVDTMLEVLSKLQEKLPELFPKPPKPIRYINNLDNILVFTSDNSEEEIKKSAEAIRSIVDFPYIMYYFKKHVTGSNYKKLQFKHTPDGELYKFNNHNSEGTKWKIISKKTKRTATFDDLLPSQETKRDYIHLPVDEEDFKKATNEKGGKWILHCADLESLDTLWKSLIRLYVTGDLVGLKSCTAIFSIKDTFSEYDSKAIMCYTSDADCKSCVKRAAQNIFICTGYSFVMYYKSNEASRTGRYRHEGFFNISKYMFTSGGEMFERDYLNRWKKCIFSEEKSINN